jgi:hypothetical protein
VLERDRISISIGSLDEPDRVAPTKQFGMEGKRAIFDQLATLPEETTDASVPAELLSRMGSRQHPDHDTESWPPTA